MLWGHPRIPNATFLPFKKQNADIKRLANSLAVPHCKALIYPIGLAIRDRFANFRMDYLDMSHLVGDERYHDRLTYDGLWENNLYQFFRIVSPKVQFDLAE